MKATRLLFALSVVSIAVSSSHVAAVTVGHVDTFSTGLEGWQKGIVNPTFLSVVAGGGPAGAGDAYMRSVADGSASFSRLTVFNQALWNSNYAADGVTAIRMDLLNSGTVPLQIRLALRDPGAQGFISASPFSLGVGGGWQPAVFPVTEAALTTVGSPGSYASFLAGGFALRILHAPSTADLNGTPVVSTLGVDNITAVPEPTTFALGAAGLATAVWEACRRRRAGPRRAVPTPVS